MTSSPDNRAPADTRPRVSIEDLFRGVPPIDSVEDLAAPDVFDTDTDAELDEFLASVRADRNADLA